MEMKKTIIIYQYAERIKSELIIASGLLAKLDTLAWEERKGAEAMMAAYFEALLGEIRIARGGEGKESVQFQKAEEKIMEAAAKLMVSDMPGINRCIAEALSAVTTVCQRAMEELDEVR
jgi:hypothetical protein